MGTYHWHIQGEQQARVPLLGPVHTELLAIALALAMQKNG